MYSVLSSVLLLGFISYGAANECKAICVLEDLSCCSRGGNVTYIRVVNGIRGLVPCMDPLHIDKVHVKVGSLDVVIKDITYRGLRGCVVKQLKIDSDKSTYKQYLHCPKLYTTFKIGGEVNSGILTITACNYDVINSGDYGVYVRNKDHKSYFFLKVDTLVTETKNNGKLDICIKRDCYEGIYEEKGHHLNKHPWGIEKYLQSPITKEVMKILIRNIDCYVRAMEMGEVLPFHLDEL